ncbi:MAG: deoxyguanosinetriphosphate triphosphohydrolase [Chloroflexi bacterium]|nr:deoxyguanosinetriphosphate triphosphohydrolase [Chloroflexota bacterium]|tara:strand:- start:33 stop:1100 length:1068 start_codon:yes stop_codon:yes gene_type:complete
MSEKSIRATLEERENLFSKYASKSYINVGRDIQEASCLFRTEYQRDRDRILHSKAFRRLKHKTQVFISPKGDHFVTRLTHTLEVSQISRTISRALNLNEDLAEAISLGHDLGHTPFGHIGEDEIDKIYANGFRHSSQSVRIVEKIEKDGKGLNLTWDVRQGIKFHSKPRGDFLSKLSSDNLTLEGQICRLSDAIAYLNHDIQDAFRAKILDISDVPSNILKILGESHSQRVNNLVKDIVLNSKKSIEYAQKSDSIPVISMSEKIKDVFYEFREFMFENVYIPEDLSEEGSTARKVIRVLYEYLNLNSDCLPIEYTSWNKDKNSVIVDYIAGMTDNYAIQFAERIEPGIAKSLIRT